MLTIGPWLSGPAWFLWVLLALGVIAALLWALPRVVEGLGPLIYTSRDRPIAAFAMRPSAYGIYLLHFIFPSARFR
jgi:hypothetical protein